MKKCTRCKLLKEPVLFGKRSKSADGLANWCKECFAENARIKFQNDPEERLRKTRNKSISVEKNYQRLVEYFGNHHCVDCGNSDPRILEFDHRDASLKTFSIAERMTYSWEHLLAEISKCDVRCRNCHAIRTQIQFGWWRSKLNTGV